MAKFDPKSKRYRGDKGKFQSREEAYKPLKDNAEVMGEAGNLLGDDFTKETLDFAKQIGDSVDKKIKEIEKSSEVIDDVVGKVQEEMKKAAQSSKKNRMTAALMMNAHEIGGDKYANQEEADAKKKEVLKDIRHAAAPKLFTAIEKLQERKEKGGFGGAMAGAVGGMLQKYEAHQLKKNGYNEMADKISKKMDQGVVQQGEVVPEKQKSTKDRMIELLEKIEKNTAEGGSGRGGTDNENDKKKPKSLFGRISDQVGGISGLAKTAFMANMMGNHQSRDAMLVGGLALAGGVSAAKKVGSMFSKKEPEGSEITTKKEVEGGDNFQEKDDSSISERMNNIYEGEKKEKPKEEKEKKSSSLMSMIMAGAKSLFSSIGTMIASLKTGIMGVVTAAMAKLAASSLGGIGKKMGGPTVAGKAGGAAGKAGGIGSKVGTVAKGAARLLGPAAAVAGAAYAGWEIGSAINEHLLTNEDGSNKIASLFKSDNEKKLEQMEEAEKKLAAVKKQSGTTVQKAEAAKSSAVEKKTTEKHVQVVNAGKNITVSNPSTVVSSAPKVRHDESSLRTYLDSRMQMA